MTPPTQVKILTRLIDLGIPYSTNMIAVSRDYLRRNPETVERLVRAYAEGVAVMNQQKDKALRESHKSTSKNERGSR